MLSELISRAPAEGSRAEEDEQAAPVDLRKVALVACVTWLVLLPAAWFAPKAFHIDPFSLRGTMLPVAAAAILIGLGLGIGRWRPAHVWSASAGMFAAWVVFTLRQALSGTPYGFFGMTDDMVRMAASATRYSATAIPSDGIVAGVPTEYPPLYPWLIGRASAITGVPAWQLLPMAEVAVTAIAVLAAFLIWTRLTRSVPLGLAAAVVGFAVYHSPWKAYELLSLGITVAWSLLVLWRPPSGRLHWVPAGVIGGFLLLNYQGYLMYAAPGYLVLAFLSWRASPERRAYAIHLVKVVVLTVIVASPFLIPLAWQRLTGGGQYVADLYPATAIADDWLPFLSFSVLGVLQLAGLAGMLLARTRSWWAYPLLVLTLGTYAYRLVYAVYYVMSGHTGMIHHAAVMTDYLFAVAGVLTVAEGTAWLLARVKVVRPRHLVAIALTVVMAWTADTCWQEWTPNPTGGALTATSTSGLQNPIILAYTQPSQSGHRARDLSVDQTPWFPVTPIRGFVDSVLGKGVEPSTLSYSEQLFAYLPWHGYITVDRTATMSTVNWDKRFAQLEALSQISDPQQFAQASANTKFGGIDVFILRKESKGWVWSPEDWSQSVVFQPAQFGSAQFAVDDTLPNGTVVVVRRP